jgi:hypothetical protein
VPEGLWVLVVVSRDQFVSVSVSVSVSLSLSLMFAGVQKDQLSQV